MISSSFWDFLITAWPGPQAGTWRADGTLADSIHMCSAGPGLRYRLDNWLTARMDYGFQLSNNANSAINGRWHIGLVASF